MGFVAALSVHPLAAHAAGEVVGRIIEQQAGPVDVAVLVVSGPHVHQLEQIAVVVRATLAPRCLVGASALGVVAGERAVVEQPAIALWAGRAPGARALRLPPDLASADLDDLGLDLGRAGGPATLAVLAGPSFPLAASTALLRQRRPALAVVGGTVAAGVRPGDNKLVCDDEVVTAGAVAIVLDGDGAGLIVSRGFRPIGVPLVVTSADGPVVRELAGRPILDRLDEVLLVLGDADAAAAGRSLQLGQVVDEHRASFGPGDFVLRQVAAVDRTARTVTVDPPIAIGSTVQFLGQDAAGADQDLRAQLAGSSAAGALLFATAARGELFADPDHDAALVSTVVDGQATVGAVCSAVVTSFAEPLVDEGPSAAAVLLPRRGGDG